MTQYTRLNVVGTVRRADLVVAQDEAIGIVLPQIIDLLAEPAGTVAHPLTLVTADGVELDVSRSAAELGLLDGSIVRLIRVDAAPPPPVVIDVADTAAERHDTRPDRWTDSSRTTLAAVGTALATGASGLLLPLDSVAALWTMLGALAVFLVGAVLMGRTPTGVVIAAAAAGLAVPIALTAGGQLNGSAGLVIASTGAAVLWATISVGIGVARRRAGALVGGALGLVLAVLLLVLTIAGMPDGLAVGIIGVVAVVIGGMLPWIALSGSGLTGQDDRSAAGERVSRTGALRSIDEAYATLTWGAAAVGATAGFAAIVLVLQVELWAGLLALALTLVLALRTRSFPLRGQGAVLWTAVIAVASVAALTHLPALSWWGFAAAAVAAAGSAVIGAVRPRPAARARLRGIGNLLESLAVVALLPLLLGVWGIYPELLSMFTGQS